MIKDKKNHIKLDKIKTSDFQFYKKVYTNHGLMKFVSKTLTEKNATKPFENIINKMSVSSPKSLLYVIRNRENQEVGVLGLRWNQSNDKHVEIGIIIIEQYQRKSYAHMAKSTMIKYAFKHFEISSIIANCNEQNLAANNANKKLGFSKIKTYFSDKKQSRVVQWRIDKL